MLFRQSAVRELTRETVTEAWDVMPEDIMAVFLGSGALAAGFDATGMQGLNFRIGQYPDTASVTHPDMLIRDNLHLYHSDALSRHYRQRREPPGPTRPDWVPMPLGWLDYIVEIDGRAYDTAAIKRHARDWRRTFTPRTGLAETSFTLAGVRLRWRCDIAPDAGAFDFAFDAEADRPVDLALTVRCHQTLRDGQPLASGGLDTTVADEHVRRSWRASTETSTEVVHRPVTITWTLACADEARGAEADDRIELRWAGQGQNLGTGIRVVCGSDRTDTHTEEYAAEQVRLLRDRGIEAALDSAATAWSGFADEGLDFEIGDPEKELLTLQQQYLLRAGQSWFNGLFSGNLWSQRFHGRTYWDAFFMADGMLRTGRVEQVRQFADWLVRTMRPDGRPHMWMTHWDGTPGTLGDTAAWFVNLNFANVQIRLYEHTHDSEDLKERAFPYLHRVAAFILDEVLGRDGEGWTLVGQTAHDVGQGDREAAKQRGVLALTAAVLGRCADYGEALGHDDQTVRTCREIADYFRDHPIDLSEPGMWDMRIPYMGDVEPFADMAGWWRYVYDYFEHLPAATYHLMPWWAASSATSLSIAGGLELEANAGATELALRCQDDATDYVCGAGYFNERLYEMQTGGFAPFLPASGAWLSSIGAMLAQGSTWDNVVNVGVNLPRRWRYQRLTYRGVTTFNGARVSGRYDPYRHAFTVDVNRDAVLRVRIPGRMEGEPARVECDGGAVADFDVEADECVRFAVTAGRHEVSVTRDLERKTDVIVVEPFFHGKELVKLAEDAGQSVRWLRDYATLKDVKDRAKVIVVNVSWVALPGEVVAELRSAAEAGAAIVGMCHAGMPDQDRAFGELVGVDAKPTEPWQFTETDRTYRLTDAGRERLVGVPDELQLPATQVYAADPADDVDVLAVDHTQGDAPAVTRRPVGRGSVWWLAPGNQSSNRRRSGNVTRRTILYGDSTANYADRGWLSCPDFQTLFQAVISAAKQ